MDMYYGQIPEQYSHLLEHNVDAKLVRVISRYGFRIAAEMLLAGKYGDTLHTHNAALCCLMSALTNVAIFYYEQGEPRRYDDQGELTGRKSTLYDLCNLPEFGQGWTLTAVLTNGSTKSLCLDSLTLYDGDSRYAEFYDGDTKLSPSVSNVFGTKTFYFGQCVE